MQLRVREAVLRKAGFETQAATTQASARPLRFTASRNTGVSVIVITGLPEAESSYRGLDVIFRQKSCPPDELIALVRSSIAGK